MLERSTHPHIARGSSLQESFVSNEHKLHWAVRRWKTLGDSSRCVKYVAHFSVSVNSLRRYKNSTPSVMPFNLVHLPPTHGGPSAIQHRCIKSSWSWPFLITHVLVRKTCDTRHLDFLMRLAVLFASARFERVLLAHSVVREAFAGQSVHRP